jgi:hypothetical protein
MHGCSRNHLRPRHSGKPIDCLPASCCQKLISPGFPPSIGLASPWPRFGVAVLPDNVLLEHKPQQGRVDLTFAKFTLEALMQRLPATLPFNVKSARAGQSAALRIAVPPVDHLRPFNEQDDNVLSVFAAVERLITVGRQIVATGSTTSAAVRASQQLLQ